MGNVETGLDRLLEEPSKWIRGDRIGLLCNPASINSKFIHARELIDQQLPGKLVALYSPQHGFFAEKQDNMIESYDMIDPVLKIPVFSLYGKTRSLTEKMFEPIDTLIVDLQDAGTRVYTFIYTLSYCLEAAKRYHKKVIVLDRPNPISGAQIEGNCLSPDCLSFVGRYPIPMRHGLTIGELAQLFNTFYGIGCDLEIIPMKGWHRNMYFQDTGLPWVAPSPNLPTPVSTAIYPGQVLLEGTNVSEGRGTTQPFELFGAPYIDTQKILSIPAIDDLPGVQLRPVSFEPTSNKWKGEVCNGFQIHITDPHKYKPYYVALRLIQAIMRCHGEEFEWKPPPYEYEYERLPIDLLIGDKKIRRRIETFDSIDMIEESWKQDLEKFSEVSRQFHLYS